jgi:3-hydroxyisobutyryl-CoA hydrolase
LYIYTKSQQIDVVNSLKDPKKHLALEHQIDTEYEMIHFMGTMKTPYVVIMDGITSKS